MNQKWACGELRPQRTNTRLSRLQVASGLRSVHRWVRGLSQLVTVEREHNQADVLVVTSGWPRPEAPARCIFIRRQMDSLADRGVRYETLIIHGDRSLAAYPLAALRLAALNFASHRYRLVHAHGGEATMVAYLYRRAPVLVSFLGGDLLGNSYRPDGIVPLGGRMKRWIIRKGAYLARATITKSAEMESALPRSRQPRNSVIPNGVDTRIFRPYDRAVARRELQWGTDEKVALFVGDPNELRKRYGLATRAVAAAQPQLGRVRLAVAHGIDPELIPVYMSAADCLLLLSWMEGSPNVVKEALMCNLPVIATPVGDVPHLLANVSPSFVVEPTLEAVTSALISCLHSAARSNGRAQSKRLSADAVADQVLALYETLGADGVVSSTRASS